MIIFFEWVRVYQIDAWMLSLQGWWFEILFLYKQLFYLVFTLDVSIIMCTDPSAGTCVQAERTVCVGLCVVRQARLTPIRRTSQGMPMYFSPYHQAL